MNTAEILTQFLTRKNPEAETVGITGKQSNWLVSQARRESIPVIVNGVGGDVYIYHNNFIYHIRQARRFASGGSYVTTRAVPNSFVLEKKLAIRYKNTGYVEIQQPHDLKRIDAMGVGYEYDIIDYYKHQYLKA